MLSVSESTPASLGRFLMTYWKQKSEEFLKRLTVTIEPARPFVDLARRLDINHLVRGACVVMLEALPLSSSLRTLIPASAAAFLRLRTGSICKLSPKPLGLRDILRANSEHNLVVCTRRSNEIRL